MVVVKAGVTRMEDDQISFLSRNASCPRAKASSGSCLGSSIGSLI